MYCFIQEYLLITSMFTHSMRVFCPGVLLGIHSSFLFFTIGWSNSHFSISGGMVVCMVSGESMVSGWVGFGLSSSQIAINIFPIILIPCHCVLLVQSQRWRGPPVPHTLSNMASANISLLVLSRRFASQGFWVNLALMPSKHSDLAESSQVCWS